MGKGDKKTKRGKLFQGSYGIKRRRSADKSAVKQDQSSIKPKEVKAPVKEVKEIKEVKDVKEVKAKATPPVKTVKPSTPVKKESKPKKPETT
jgi:ribosomal small subunit protein bTHX